MKRGPTGTFEVTAAGGQRLPAFVPAPLPPEPPLRLSANRQRLLEQALLACGRLDAVTTLLPEPNLFLDAYVRREAVLSSRMDGTRSSVSDLLLFELGEKPGVPIDDVVEVSNYVAALEHGLARLRERLPLSNELLRELHGILLSRGRGAGNQPGEFRRSEDPIGGGRRGKVHYVPPPPAQVEPCMEALERFVNDDDGQLPTLAKVALAHAQLETIHPFLDGNGRVGRLVIALMLHNDGVLRQPLLYLSLYLKQHRSEYDRLLELVRTEGDWEAWLDFFLLGVIETADAAVDTAGRLLSLFREDAERIRGLGRAAANALRVFDALRARPVTTVNDLASRAGVAYPTAARAVAALEKTGITREITGRNRNRVYVYERYLDLLNEGAEPL